MPDVPDEYLTPRFDALPMSPALYDEAGRLRPAIPIPLSDAPDRPSAVPDEVREVVKALRRAADLLEQMAFKESAANPQELAGGGPAP